MSKWKLVKTEGDTGMADAPAPNVTQTPVMSSLDEQQGKSSPKPVATSTTRSAGGVSDSLDEILEAVKRHYEYTGVAKFPAPEHLNVAEAEAQIKAWVAEEIIGADQEILPDTLATDVKHSRNELRQEQIKRLEES